MTLVELIDAAVTEATKAFLPVAAIKHLTAARTYAEAAASNVMLDASKLPPVTKKQCDVFKVLTRHPKSSKTIARESNYPNAMDALYALEREGYATKMVVEGVYHWRALAEGVPRPNLMPYASRSGPREWIDHDDLSPLALRILKALRAGDGVPEGETPIRVEAAKKQMVRLGLITTNSKSRYGWAITEKGKRLLDEGRVAA